MMRYKSSKMRSFQGRKLQDHHLSSRSRGDRRRELSLIIRGRLTDSSNKFSNNEIYTLIFKREQFKNSDN